MSLAALIPAANDDYSLQLSVPAIAPFVDEIVVLDDASIDGTSDVLQLLSERIPHLRVVNSHDPLGWTAARNQLLSLTDARHLLFMDADDIFCEWQVDALREIVDSPLGHVQLGLVETIADFRHGTGRGMRMPHHDPCHCYIDRHLARGIEWRHRDTFSFVVTAESLQKAKTETVLFCHAKGVKSDWRLCWRGQVRRWLRAGQRDAFDVSREVLHRRALKRLFASTTDPIELMSPEVRLPEVCVRERRFEVVYADGKMVDRIDREQPLEA